VTETENSFLIHCDLPGVKRENIKLELGNGKLRMSAVLDKEKRKETDVRRSVERRFGRFERVFSLPDGADSSNIKATCSEGVLAIEIPKLETKTHKIHTISIA